MNNLQAIGCEVSPYCSGDNELEFEKALLSAGKRAGVALDATEEYTPDNDRIIALAAVMVLVKNISLSSEKEGEWSQGYNDKLKDRIAYLCRTADVPVEEFMPDTVIKLSHASNRF
ncbi:MAG: hypothetical protein NC131_09820 [Roseburia sp.]|nr:hypothetical protein [Roseburia sp.]